MNIQKIEANPLLKHSFALSIDEYTSKLYDLRKYDLARQLFRSGTSIGANAFESQHAESKFKKGKPRYFFMGFLSDVHTVCIFKYNSI